MLLQGSDSDPAAKKKKKKKDKKHKKHKKHKQKKAKDGKDSEVSVLALSSQKQGAEGGCCSQLCLWPFCQ